MRGTRTPDLFCCNVIGIIPAYAGNTWRCARSGRTVRDHPRVCGEHMAFRADADQTTGSSPRMRGTLRTCGSSTATPRIIPAYAGNTQVHMAGRVPLWDHPRVCGEHVKIDSGILTSTGSSPRMRGTQYEPCRPCRQPGIIPAYAGNTRSCPNRTARRWDHPRVCGEHPGTTSIQRRQTGSSPRMRGTLVRGLLGGRQTGIIPAYAGNTGSMHAATSKSWDHPRVCGEHLLMMANHALRQGSSPRMRGTRVNCGGMRLANGDHPRVCGEHSS